MKKILFFALFALIFGFTVNVALAGGDQVVGGGFGKGGVEVNQNQVNCESPWLCPDTDE